MNTDCASSSRSSTQIAERLIRDGFDELALLTMAEIKNLCRDYLWLACHGAGSVERADLAAIRKRWEESGRPAFPALLEIVAAQAREIEELKG